MKYDIIFLGDGIMKYISNFLNNTTLTAGEQIAVSVISAFIMIVLTPAIAKIYKLIQAKIAKLLKPVKEKFQRYIRFKKGKLNINDYIELQERLEKGQTLSKREMKAIDKATKELDKLGVDTTELSKLIPPINNINIPKFFK